MKTPSFGTDGVRGVANENLTPEFVFQLGRSAGIEVVEQGWVRRVVIGRDTRRSGTMLGAALAAGFCSVGVNVTSLGVAPTGAISFAARTGDYGLGAVISASHNPFPDNGIKLISHSGTKLAADYESSIAARVGVVNELRPTGAGIGEITTDRSDLERYLEMLVSIVPERLDGMSVCLDAGHGAGYELGPEALRRLGAAVSTTGCEPSGVNINEEGGATKPQTIQSTTQQTGAIVGVAFDGDADRAVFSDSEGRLFNGDRTIAIWAAHWRQRGGLDPSTVVGTVMSNSGFESYMCSQGIQFERTAVGDKYVAERMRATGARIGGEQSGHLIFAERGPTGDGLITMLELLRVVKREGRPLSEMYGDYVYLPQVLVNLKVPDTKTWDQGDLVREALCSAEMQLTGLGRMVVRASGTQPMVRIMVEAQTFELRDKVTANIESAMQRELGATEYSRVDLTYALGD